LFSPRGVSVATMAPDALQELTSLGVALVKTQGSPTSRVG
jgi:hypothetical protein